MVKTCVKPNITTFEANQSVCIKNGLIIEVKDLGMAFRKFCNKTRFCFVLMGLRSRLASEAKREENAKLTIQIF